jgi:hypothetical protein
MMELIGQILGNYKYFYTYCVQNFASRYSGKYGL